MRSKPSRKGTPDVQLSNCAKAPRGQPAQKHPPDSPLTLLNRSSNSLRTYSSCRAKASWMGELATLFQLYRRSTLFMAASGGKGEVGEEGEGEGGGCEGLGGGRWGVGGHCSAQQHFFRADAWLLAVPDMRVEPVDKLQAGNTPPASPGPPGRLRTDDEGRLAHLEQVDALDGLRGEGRAGHKQNSA